MADREGGVQPDLLVELARIRQRSRRVNQTAIGQADGDNDECCR